VTETLALFSKIGFHETTVRDISEAAQISRATLYQYFESKDEIFVELLDECGGALLRVVRRAGPLGPTDEGFENLKRWLADWSEVYSKYGTLFVQWANVDAPGTSVRPLVSNFLRTYNLRIASRFRKSGLTGMDFREAAIVTTCVVHRFNHLRHALPPAAAPSYEAIEDIAIVLQMILFPSTPVSVLGRSPVPTSRRRKRLAAPPAAQSASAKLEGLTSRSAATVGQIMQAGARCFAESGYHGANVDDIVRCAGFARGTFYKYFDEKLDLLLALSEECEANLYDLIVRFTDIPPAIEGAQARREWIEEYLDFRAVYSGVMHAWIDRSPRAPALDDARKRTAKLIHESLDLLLGAGRLAGVVTAPAADTLLTGVLERLPDAIVDNRHRVRREQIVELIATVIERGLFDLDIHAQDESA